MYNKLFNIVKSIIPKISETELIALRSGGVSIDRDLFSGRIDYKNLRKQNQSVENPMIEKTKKLLEKYGDATVYPSKHIDKILADLGQQGFLGLIIDKKYGGNRLPITAQSEILTLMSSYNPSLAVTTMVPNSLGPGELLQHYGTDEQKAYYLPKLANGSMIPCFGLTGPNNGSDATGSIDTGTLSILDGKKMITVELNKRYITLAPVADLIGIAFNLKDPQNLVDPFSGGKAGVTLALLERNHPGLKLDTHHDPNGAGFPNGTIKGSVCLPLDAVIGGEAKLGHGWQMLMECLAVGRGVSLPANANGASKAITFGIKHYIQNRRQFKMPIGKMEGVREKFLDMFYNTWVIQSSVAHTNAILDSGVTPSVLTAIMKQQTTERSRKVLLHGMDIYAGSAICKGPNNFFTKFYNASPVGITVEGSNTLTRSLIIFGQGLNKSHPHIYNIFDAIQGNDQSKFKKEFNSMVSFATQMYFRSLRSAKSGDRLERLAVKFANLSNFVALLGGKIKSQQMISGAMADILSNLYLAQSVIWYFNNVAFNTPRPIIDFVLNRLYSEIETQMNTVIVNYPISGLKPFLKLTAEETTYRDFQEENRICSLILEDLAVEEHLKKDIFIKGTILEDLEKLSSMSNSGQHLTQEKERLYQKVISVGEYPILC